jgi:hypothetical protein
MYSQEIEICRNKIYALCSGLCQGHLCSILWICPEVSERLVLRMSAGLSQMTMFLLTKCIIFDVYLTSVFCGISGLSGYSIVQLRLKRADSWLMMFDSQCSISNRCPLRDEVLLIKKLGYEGWKQLKDAGRRWIAEIVFSSIERVLGENPLSSINVLSWTKTPICREAKDTWDRPTYYI